MSPICVRSRRAQKKALRTPTRMLSSCSVSRFWTRFSSSRLNEWQTADGTCRRNCCSSTDPVDLVAEDSPNRGVWRQRGNRDRIRSSRSAALARGGAHRFGRFRRTAGRASASPGVARPAPSSETSSICRSRACIFRNPDGRAFVCGLVANTWPASSAAHGWPCCVIPSSLRALRARAGADTEIDGGDSSLRVSPAVAFPPRIEACRSSRTADCRRLIESILRIASANRDPRQFPNPDRIDFSRRATAQLSLGFGPHSCVGAALIRTSAKVATRVFVEKFGGVRNMRPGGMARRRRISFSGQPGGALAGTGIQNNTFTFLITPA